MSVVVDRDAALTGLDSATCSDGAPSARNLIVTVFGDIVGMSGHDAEVTVRDIATLLADFDVNERLVRTSLSRIANDGLVESRPSGRRSFYRVAPAARELFRSAEQRIYRGAIDSWDGSWTLVVVDGNEATPARRAELRQQLAWAGFGVVAPNVMASPIVTPAVAAEVVSRVGGFDHVLVSRSTVVDGDGLLGREALARRSADLGDVEQRYGAFTDRFALFSDDVLAELDDRRSFKLRTLLVSTFRRIALGDPQLPRQLMADDWAGHGARAEAARVYAAVAGRADRYATGILGITIATPPTRLAAD
jgi:phenylacetic acid degradation operon negative regulatory protein